ncbi:MAG: tRNA pseudouridine(55) synthase TruB [Candidatus Handelsmanbacteria bacterium RIFCSPLOWO2_12_FULL_64_10]|uniref:tRNA pseudouridine synthase B n=1 Tax=Handelsmanbacteria sp. (strain RIFCSPLOWO2_12_FULL_64_10) TaxID=1817868 RepID=A0A1F6CK68_HANXR|nr:MAG: tRNA pseudouridine(55) synthase TruB [Candidatus Handelsmanbacteria bacterium RIFCSPLOWO2_12_FULL_64_10]
MADLLEGILPVDKPQGWTSHDVVARLRRLTGVRRIGHAGTLDPMATGVLLLCLGRATRVVSFLTDAEKEYRFRVRLGVSTDTYDAEGQVVARSDVIPTDLDAVRRTVAQFEGEIDQVPPMFSALKVGGRKLYDLARRGEVVERTARRVHIRQIEVEGLRGADLDLRVVCSKGTYVRSLADDLGRVLGCGGHVTALRRTRVGEVRVEACETPEAIEGACQEGGLPSLLLPMERALLRLPAFSLDWGGLVRFCSGANVRVEGIAPLEEGQRIDHPMQVRVVGRDGHLYGIGVWVGAGVVRAKAVLREAKNNITE